MFQYISMLYAATTFSVEKRYPSEEDGDFEIKFEQNGTTLSIAVSKKQLQQLANVLRNVAYPQCRKERVKVCIQGTLPKSIIEAGNINCVTPTQVLSSFLKSFQPEDLTFGTAENTSKTENSSEESGDTSMQPTTLELKNG